MASLQQNIEWLTRHPSQVKRYARILQVIAGLLLLAAGYFMGKHQLALILWGTRTSGVIVAYKQKDVRVWQTEELANTSYMPVVEYRAGGNLVRFEDWLGSRLPGVANTNVVVLYDAAHPSGAMIDRPVWNWLPWAPVSLVGTLLFLAGAKNLIWKRD
jgi:hypothetical protein